jgi:hypothetical protein
VYFPGKTPEEPIVIVEILPEPIEEEPEPVAFVPEPAAVAPEPAVVVQEPVVIIYEPAPSGPKEPLNITIHTYVISKAAPKAEAPLPPAINIILQKSNAEKKPQASVPPPAGAQPPIAVQPAPPAPAQPPAAVQPKAGVSSPELNWLAWLAYMTAESRGRDILQAQRAPTPQPVQQPGSIKPCHLIVGTYSNFSTASVICQQLRKTGFDGQIQKQPANHYKVIAVNVPANLVYYAAERLGAMGFTEIWISE